MKIKKLTISGMHKVMHKVYEFNDGITYFVGENGAGKSTILEAIELALLGYIPGYAKTNESIMKHACGPSMVIILELDSGITITRTWVRTGSSVTAKLDVQGHSIDIASLLGNVELPVFDFNEFRSMTANKLKEWFISFLPNSADQLDLVSELEQNATERALPYDEILDRASTWIDAQAKDLSAVDLVKSLNAYLKEEQSYTKGQVAKLQGTIESLVRYDEVSDDFNEEELNAAIEENRKLDSLLSAYEAKESVRKQYESSIASLKSGLPADSFDNDPRVPELLQKADNLSKEAQGLSEVVNKLNQELAELQGQKAIIHPASPVCPYTNETCETASLLSNKMRAAVEELGTKIEAKKKELLDCNPLRIDMLMRESQDCKNQVSAIRAQYDRLTVMQAQIVDAGELPTTLSHEEIADKIRSAQDLLVKIAANKRYDELTSTVTQDKFKLENELEILKSWIKLTDANGLQSTLMDGPFIALASDMSKYLSAMFNAPTEAKFNLVSKANSFSFGLVRDGSYIEFDYLSSGERCLFTLALILCILDKSQSQIRTLIIDDILDHLDSSNANYLFEALKGVDVQFILAGVKECADASICKSV